jgi:hypothetical protein
MKSNGCKSSLARAVAGGPVASVAIRRVTGGCRSVHSEKAGRECSAPKTLYRCDADAVSLAEGCIRSTDMQGVSGVAGVPSPGHAFKETSREHRRAHDLCRTTGVWFTQIRTNRAVGSGEGVFQTERTNPRRSSQPTPRETGGVEEGSASSLTYPYCALSSALFRRVEVPLALE